MLHIQRFGRFDKKVKDKTPLAKIRPIGRRGGSGGKIVYTIPDEGDASKYKFNADSRDEILLIPQNERETIYVTGPPKCGKTYFMERYVENAKKLYPEKKVILFTSLDPSEFNEELYDDIQRVSEIDLSDPYDLHDFDNSIVIFDDIETSRSPKIVKYLHDLIDELIRNGRHVNATVLYLTQQSRDGNKTRVALQNADKIVCFPTLMSPMNFTRLAKEYCGLSKMESDYLANRPYSDPPFRWAAISIAVPRLVATNREIYMLGKHIHEDGKDSSIVSKIKTKIKNKRKSAKDKYKRSRSVSRFRGRSPSRDDTEDDESERGFADTEWETDDL